MIDIVHQYFGGEFEQALLEEMIEMATYEELAENTVLMDVGHYIKSMPLLLNGRIKVSRLDEQGGELLLYYLSPGQTCSVSLNCALERTKSEIRAVTEESSALLKVPISKMEEWMSEYKTWRQYVLNAYQQRFDELLHTIDSIAFQKMDERLINYLQQRANKTNCIEATHLEIATDLHTSRVVVSRLLKKLEEDGIVVLGRNRIELHTV